MTLTIIEGPDAVGKTTFAEKIAEARGARYLHADRPTEPNWVLEYVAPISAALQMDPERDIVCDRWHFGEVVWSVLFDRESLFVSMFDVDACNRALVAMCGKVELLLVTRDEAGIVATLRERGEDDQIDLVLKSQKEFVRKFELMPTFPGFTKELVQSNAIHGEGYKAYV